jgi:hypothetical protein
LDEFCYGSMDEEGAPPYSSLYIALKVRCESAIIECAIDQIRHLELDFRGWVARLGAWDVILLFAFLEW